MKEVNNYWGNCQDVMGKDCKFWFMPFDPNERPTNGFDWQINSLH
jgi:hypothetical protein